VDTILASARSVPMMAKRRFVLVRSLERWESRAEQPDEEPARGKGAGKAEGPLDRLAAYAADPCPCTVLVLVATKLHGSRRIVTSAKRANFVVACDPLRRGEPGPWVAARAKRLGHAMSRDVAETIADLIGSDLGALSDAVERLSLFVGQGAEI